MADISKPKNEADFELATEEYREIVRQCAERDLPLELSNRHIGHAAILFNAALKHSSRSMDILTGGLPELFIEKIKTELGAALERGVAIRITVIKPITDEIRKGLCNFPGIRLYQVPDDLRPEIAVNMPHFYISDDHRYRLEFKHDIDKDFSKFPDIDARASFNQPSVVTKLRKAFNDLVSVCDPVPVS